MFVCQWSRLSTQAQCRRLCHRTKSTQSWRSRDNADRVSASPWLKASTISELYLEVPQRQSCISRKFSNFNFQAIARNISRFLFSSYLLIHFCIPQDSNREHSGQEASTFPTELSSILIRNCAPTWRRRKKLSTREIPRNVSRFMLTEPR